jgi:hypothetical protein
MKKEEKKGRNKGRRGKDEGRKYEIGKGEIRE